MEMIVFTGFASRIPRQRNRAEPRYPPLPFSGNPRGVIIQLRSKESSNIPALMQFVATLREAGIEPHGETDERIAADQFKIVIGSRPD
jgi:hypothetical protein